MASAGWRLAVCTGRPGRGSAMEIARRLDPEGLHVFESGGVVLDTAGRVFESHPIPAASVAAVARFSTENALTLEAYTAQGRYLVAQRDPYVLSHEVLLGVPAELVDVWPPTEDLVRLQWLMPRARWEAVLASHAGVLEGISAHEARAPSMPEVSFVSMTRRGISKADGMRAVLAAYGLGPEQAAMVGDNNNDIDGLKLVSRRFVPEDGAPAARALADHLVPSPRDGGVAEAARLLLAWTDAS